MNTTTQHKTNDCLKQHLMKMLCDYIANEEPVAIAVVCKYFSELELEFKRLNPTSETVCESTYEINGSIIDFFAPDNLTKVFYPKRDILFCIGIDGDTYKELAIRTSIATFRLN